MARNIEERGVKMTFDNAGFERQISATMSSLEALKQKLSLSGASEGIQAVQGEMDKFNVNAISAGIEGVSKSFLALSTIAITALSEITSKAIDAGTQIVKSLTLDPVMDGFREYEINMNSIQTILANTRKDGTNLQDVNGALDELNEYSDKTIYNFAQMTKNIGSATAAGVDLDTAVQYVKGFANSAAVAGVSSEEMAGAMVQMSQALGAGVIKAQDWISLERRGLATQATQEAFYETAKAMGTLADVPVDQSFEEWQAAGNTLRGSLADGWLTADVFLNTMKVFTGEMDEAALATMGFSAEAIPAMLELGQVGVESATKVRTLTQLFDTAKESVASGWSQTFRVVFGDFEEATELFSGLSDAFGAAVGAQAEARNELLAAWSKGGGRLAVLDGLRDGFLGIKNIIDGVREAFREIFPRKTADELIDMSEKFAKLMAQFREATERGLPTIKLIFTGFFATLSIGFEIFKELGKVVFGFFKILLGLGTGAAVGPLKKLAEFMTNLRKSLVEEGGIAKFFEEFGESVNKAAVKIREITVAVGKFIQTLLGKIDFSAIGDFFKDIYSSIFGGISAVYKGGEKGVEAAGKGLEKAVSVGERVGNVLKAVWGGLVGAVKAIGSALGSAFGAIKDVVGSALGGIDIGKVAAVGGAAGLAGIFVELRKIAKNGLQLDFGFGSALEELTNHLKVMQQKVKSEILKNIAISIALLAGSIVLLSFVDGGEIAKSLAAMTASLAGLIAAFAVINNLAIGPGMTAKIIAIGATLLLLAAALVIMGLATKFFGAMDMEELGKGLIGVGAGLTALIKGVNSITVDTKGMITAGIAMVIVAGALALLAIPIKLLGDMNWEELARGLIGVAGGMTALVLAVNSLPKDSGKRTAGLVGLALALTLLVIPIWLLSRLSIGELAKGIIAMGSALTAMGLALRTFPKNLALTGGQMILFSIGFILLAKALEAIGSLSIGTIVKGILTIAASMYGLSLVMKSMSKAGIGALAFLAIVYSLEKLAGVIQIFAGLGLLTVIGGLLLLSVAMAAIAGVSLLLAPAAPAMLAVAGALALLGLSLFLAGAGIALFATGFATLVAVGAAGSVALIKSIKAIIDVVPYLAKAASLFVLEFVKGLSEGIPMIIGIFTELVTALLVAIQGLIPVLVETIVVLISNLLEGIRELVPEFVETGWAIIMAFIQGLRDNIGELVTTAVDIVLEFIGAMTEKIPEIAKAGADYIIALIKGIQESMSDIISAGVDAVLAFVQGIADNIVKVVDKGFEIVIGFINGLADTIENRRGELADAGWNLIDAILGGILEKAEEIWTWATNLIGTFKTKIGNTIGALFGKGYDFIIGLWNGIWARVQSVITWFGDLKDKLLGWIGDVSNWLYDTGRQIMSGLWEGMKDFAKNSIKAGAGWLFDTFIKHPIEVVSGQSSPAKEMMPVGRYISEGLAVGIEQGGASVAEAAKGLFARVSESAILDDKDLTGAIRSFVQTVAASLNEIDAIEHSPTITPVLDLSNIRASSKEITNLLAADSAYASAASIARTQIGAEDSETVGAGRGDLVFNQVINAPTQLSTSDIYRGTRTQIQMAKEELEIR